MKVLAFCPTCGRDTPHEVLRVKSGDAFGGELVVRCTVCGTVHTIVRRRPEVRERRLGITVSWLGESEFKEVELREDRLIRVGDVLEVDGIPVRITRVEAGGPVEEARVSEITSIWGVRYDRVRVKVAFRDLKIRHYRIEMPPERVLAVGEELEVGGRRGRIYKMKLKDGRILKRGATRAGDVERVYVTETASRPRGRGPRA